MSKFVDDNEQIIRFVLLTCGLLTLAGAVACLLLGNAILAVACCVISAWSIGLYLDTLFAGLIQISRSKRGESGEQRHE